MSFADRDDAKVWMIKHELEWKGRKITPYIRSTLALKMESIIADKAKARQIRKPISVLENSPKQNSETTPEEPFGKTKALLNELKTKLSEQEPKVTMEDIAKQLEVDKSTVSRIIEKLQNGKNAEMQQNFQPQLYNIWNFSRNNNETKHFGNVPTEITENLLYAYTKPFDIVFDPFGGGGATIQISIFIKHIIIKMYYTITNLNNLKSIFVYIPLIWVIGKICCNEL